MASGVPAPNNLFLISVGRRESRRALWSFELLVAKRRRESSDVRRRKSRCEKGKPLESVARNVRWSHPRHSDDMDR